MKFCTNCGAQLPEGTKFCTECGQRIEQAEAPAEVMAYSEPVNQSIPEPNVPVQAEPAYEPEPAAPQVQPEPAPPVYQEPVRTAEPVSEPQNISSYNPPVMSDAEQAPAPKAKQSKKLPLPLIIGAAVIALVVLVVALFGGGSGLWWLAMLMLLCTGCVLSALGIVGEYIARIYDESRGRPLYIVTEAIGFDQE